MSDLVALAAAGPTPYIAGGLALSGAAVTWSRRRELIRRWLTWTVTAPLVGGAFLLGPVAVAVLAAGAGIVCGVELARLVRMPRLDRAVLVLTTVAAVALAYAAPGRLSTLLLATPLISALPAVLEGDGRQGGRRAAWLAFGILWLASLTGLVTLGHHAFAVIVAVSVSDVAAWCAGKALGGPRLSPLSPGKRWTGWAGAAIAGSTALWLFGALTWPLLLAVAVGGPIGDLVESMVKREAGVKDAGTWLPGFGGLLDRVDSLLIALTVAVVLS